MLSFHNDIKIKAKYVKRVAAHYKADRIVQGTGWNGYKGCAVGCTLEKYDHTQYPVELGLPIWLANLEDRLFEGMRQVDALEWPGLFLNAIPVGVTEQQFLILKHKLAVWRLKRNIKIQETLSNNRPCFNDVFNKVIEASKLVILYHKQVIKTGNESAAEPARSAAESAAWSAARSAAESAAWSARSAAKSAAASAAWSATRSAAESARSAACYKESRYLLKLLRELK